MKSFFVYVFKEGAGTAELGKPPSAIAEHKLISSAHGGHAAALIYCGNGNFETIKTLDAGPAMSREFL